MWRSCVSSISPWVLAGLLVTSVAAAATPAALQAGYAAIARNDSPSFPGFSAARGEVFFKSTHGNDWSCASCHTVQPVEPGRHAVTGKVIAPLAPVANPDRFTDTAKAEKWFGRNCQDVLGRPCTVGEKGDVLAYLLSLSK